MGRVLVQADVRKTFHGIDRDKQEPDDLKQEVERKIRYALEEDGAEVDVTVVAKDG